MIMMITVYNNDDDHGDYDDDFYSKCSVICIDYDHKVRPRLLTMVVQMGLAPTL